MGMNEWALRELKETGCVMKQHLKWNYLYRQPKISSYNTFSLRMLMKKKSEDSATWWETSLS